MRFRFESRTEVYAEQRVEHREANGSLWTYDCEAAEGPPLVLHRLLSKKIVAVEREDLRLTFEIEDGSSLIITSELGAYESGHITTAQGGFQVF